MTTYLNIFPSSWAFQTLPTVLFVTVLTVFVIMLIQSRVVRRRIRNRISEATFNSKMMEQALKISANNVVRYDIREKHLYQLYGHLYPDGGLTAEQWKSHVHPDDLEATLLQFHDIIDGKIRRFELSYRWNYDYTGNTPRWGYMYNTSIAEILPGMTRPLSILSTVRDETELRQQEIEDSELAERYKLIFEHSIIGLSFYSPEGWLLNSNKMMRDICHFDSDTTDAYFSNTNLFDAMPFNEVLDRHNVQEVWFCSQSIVPERNIHDYLEIHVHPIRDDAGKLIYITIATRNITEERDMYLQIKLNDAQIQKVNDEIMHYEEELHYMMEATEMRAWKMSFEERKVRIYKGLGTLEKELTFDETEQLFIDIPENIRQGFHDPYTYLSKPLGYAAEMRSIFTEGDGTFWNQINSIPVYDDDGNLTGCFGLVRNITGMMRKQEQLKRETERANDSGRLKSAFLANMTHEIRTPLNAIVGFTDLLQAIDSPDDKREMIRVIHNNCDMLIRLINDIIDLSNVDANAMEINPRDVDIAEDFDELCKTLAQRVQEPTVEFIADNPYETLKSRVDADRISQVFTNFVTNAVKYTHQGHIRLGIRLEERNGQQGIYSYCEDTGSGIPKDMQGAIFERFVKLNDYVQGTGLGLPICKAIIEKCGGEIGVGSEVDKGSTFWFWIPIPVLEVKERA